MVIIIIYYIVLNILSIYYIEYVAYILYTVIPYKYILYIYYRAVVPNLFGTRDWLRGRQFFHGKIVGGGVEWFRR